MMIRACLFLLAGLYAPQLISFGMESDLVTAALVAALVALVMPALRALGFVLLGSACFVNAACVIIDSRLAPELVGDSIMVQVIVEEFPKSSGRSVSFLARPLDDNRIPPRIRVSWFEPPVNVRLGDRWRLELRLRRPRGTSNPGLFDYETWLFRESIGATAYVVDSHRNRLLESGPSGTLNSVRHRFVNRVTGVVSDPEQAAVLAALVVGGRHLLSDEQWNRYARTGTSHLMAISGLHIGLAASGGYLLTCLVLAVCRFGGNQHHAAIVAAVCVAAFYALVSGLAIPARRAVVMLTVVAIILLRRRRPNPALVVSLACIGIVLIAPLATMTPGFKLSFAAVVALLWAGRRKSLMMLPAGFSWTRVIAPARRLWALQMMLLCGLLPLTALIFGRVALAAPPVNLLAVPLFSLLTVPLALLGFVLAGPLEFAGDRLLASAALSIGWLDVIIERVASLNWSALDVAAIAGVAWLFVLLPAVWTLLPPGWPCRNLGWIAVLALVLYVPRPPVVGCMDARVLDVGQGLSVLVRTGSGILLFDTGPAFRSGGNAARSIVLPQLARLRIEQVDYLVVSHSDNDHAGGVAAILDGVNVVSLIVGEPLADVDAEQRRCDTRLGWETDGVRFRFLHPAVDAEVEGNDASCVLQIEAGAHRLLLTGDIERAAEERLLASGLMQPVDVVTVPHHGSRTSSTPAFVQALTPSVAIVSNGFGNRWGFPQAEIAARWEIAGSELLQTADSGAISISFCADSAAIRVQRHRQMRHRIWHE